MTDIARLGYSVDTSELVKGRADLEAMIPSAQKVQSAAASVSMEFGKMGDGMRSAASGAQSTNSAMNEAAAGGGRLGAMLASVVQWFQRLRGSTTETVLELNQVAPAASKAESALNRMGKAANDNINRMQSTPGNIAAQFQDIGVTAAAGMSPMLIALQQGTQLSAAFAGGGLANLGGALKQLLSPTTLLTIGFVALVAVLIEWAMKAFDASTAADELAKSMSKGVQEADFFGKAQDAVGKAFDTTTGKLKTHNEILVQYIKLQAQANILAAQAARQDATKAVTSAGKSTLGDIVRGALSINDLGDTSGYNEVLGKSKPLQDILGTFSTSVNDTRLTVQGLGKATDIAIAGIDKLAKTHQMANHDIIATKKAVLDLATARGTEFANQDAVTSINQGHLTSSLITPRVTHPHADKKPPHDSFQDIVEGAQGDIDKENALATAAAMDKQSAAAYALEEKTKLLSEARSKEIKLTDAQQRQLTQLALAYGDAKKAAEDATAIDNITRAADKQVAALQDAADEIGLYGQDLKFVTYLQQMYNAAAEHGVRLTDAQKTAFANRASEMAAQASANDHDKFMEGVAENAHQATAALAVQRGEYNLGSVALAAYNREAQILLDAQKQHIPLTQEEIVGIHQQAIEWAQTTDAINTAADALSFARDTAHGFFDDWYKGILQGKNIFSSFADAVVNGLNKIIDRLMNKAINSFLDNMLGNLGAGGGNFLTRLFGTPGSTAGLGASASGPLSGKISMGQVVPSALGNVFTNSVVSDPTLFTFARGGALGVMGEAGPEAVMPLKRGPDGSLGVQSHGRSGPTQINMPTENHYHLDGAVSVETIMAMIRQADENTKGEVRRNLMPWLNEIQRDGATV